MQQSIGDRIRLERLRGRLSQIELAARVGLTQHTVSKIENDMVDLKLSYVRTFARVLDVSVAYLLGLEAEASRKEPAPGAAVGV